MADNASLSAAHIRYLVALKKLDRGDGVKSIELALELNITKPSVHSMMNVLLGMEYVRKEPQQHIYLTEQGLGQARLFERHFNKVKERLFGTGAAGTAADLAIYAFLAELPADTLETMF